MKRTKRVTPSGAIYHGCFNSFLMVDGRGCSARWLARFSREAATRYHHLSLDGYIVAMADPKYAVRMVYFNADGSRAALCLNGVRCLAAFVSDIGMVSKNKFSIITDAGVVGIELLRPNSARERLVRCQVPLAAIERARQMDIGGRRYVAVDVGVPHAVTFVPHHRFDWAGIGERVERMKQHFPHGTNVNFVQRISASRLVVRTWERGSGAVLSCGTGACASAIAAILSRRVRRSEVTVETPGGTLRIRWRKGTSGLQITGPAVRLALM